MARRHRDADMARPGRSATATDASPASADAPANTSSSGAGRCAHSSSSSPLEGLLEVALDPENRDERSLNAPTAPSSSSPASTTSGAHFASLPARKSSSTPRNACSSPWTACSDAAASRRSRRVSAHVSSINGPASHPHRLPSRPHAASFTASRRRRRCQAISGWAGVVIVPFHCRAKPTAALVNTTNVHWQGLFSRIQQKFPHTRPSPVPAYRHPHPPVPQLRSATTPAPASRSPPASRCWAPCSRRR